MGKIGRRGGIQVRIERVTFTVVPLLILMLLFWREHKEMYRAEPLYCSRKPIVW